jgi:hypothetical protein
LATAIEQLLYGGRGIHGVTEFTASPGGVRLRLVPWEGPRVETVAVFGEARLTSVETYPDSPDDLDLPWDVIGFDCEELGDGRWRFILHCDAIEFGFDSTWPAVSRDEH